MRTGWQTWCKEAKPMMFYDERGQYITEEQLREEFETLKKYRETDAETFEQYVRNCTSGNGTLTIVKEKS